MSDIFREVDEALQREKAEKFWNEYGSTLLIGAVLLVIGTALGVAWRTWDHSRDQAETARLVRAMDSETSTAQLKTIIGDTRGGAETIALLTAAGQSQANGDASGASALYRQAAESNATPRELRDLARLQFVRISPDATSEQKHAVLKPVLDNENSPFIWHARIEAALIEASGGNYKTAIEYLADFKSDAALPPTLLERASALKQVYLAQIAKE